MKLSKIFSIAVAAMSVILGITGCGLLSGESGVKYSSQMMFSEKKTLMPYYQVKGSIDVAAGNYNLVFTFWSTSSFRNEMVVERSDSFVMRFKNGQEWTKQPVKSYIGTKMGEDYKYFEITIPITKEELSYMFEVPLYSVEWIMSDKNVSAPNGETMNMKNIYTEMEIPIDRYVSFANIMSLFFTGAKLDDNQTALLTAPQKTIISEDQWYY